MAALQYHLISPFGYVDGVDESSRLDTKSGPRSSGWSICRCRNFDMLSKVELETRLGAEHVQMQSGLGVRNTDQRLELFLSRVKGNM